MKTISEALDELYAMLKDTRQELYDLLNPINVRCPNCGFREFDRGFADFYICKRCGCVFGEIEGLEIGS